MRLPWGENVKTQINVCGWRAGWVMACEAERYFKWQCRCWEIPGRCPLCPTGQSQFIPNPRRFGMMTPLGEGAPRTLPQTPPAQGAAAPLTPAKNDRCLWVATRWQRQNSPARLKQLALRWGPMRWFEGRRLSNGRRGGRERRGQGLAPWRPDFFKRWALIPSEYTANQTMDAERFSGRFDRAPSLWNDFKGYNLN